MVALASAHRATWSGRPVLRGVDRDRPGTCQVQRCKIGIAGRELLLSRGRDLHATYGVIAQFRPDRDFDRSHRYHPDRPPSVRNHQPSCHIARGYIDVCMVGGHQRIWDFVPCTTSGSANCTYPEMPEEVRSRALRTSLVSTSVEVVPLGPHAEPSDDSASGISPELADAVRTPRLRIARLDRAQSRDFRSSGFGSLRFRGDRIAEPESRGFCNNRGFDGAVRILQLSRSFSSPCDHSSKGGC